MTYTNTFYKYKKGINQLRRKSEDLVLTATGKLSRVQFDPLKRKFLGLCLNDILVLDPNFTDYRVEFADRLLVKINGKAYTTPFIDITNKLVSVKFLIYSKNNTILLEVFEICQLSDKYTIYNKDVDSDADTIILDPRMKVSKKISNMIKRFWL